MLQETMCLIAGRCYALNDTRSENKTCWKCLPNITVSAWSWGTYTSDKQSLPFFFTVTIYFAVNWLKMRLFLV